MRRTLMASAFLALSFVNGNAGEVQKPDVYLQPANQALLFQASSAVGALAACEAAFNYTIPGHHDEIAMGRLIAIFGGAEEGSLLRMLGASTYRVFQMSQQRKGWLTVKVVGDQVNPDKIIDMDSKKACEKPLEFLDVLMAPGGLLDLVGSLEKGLKADEGA